jgi:hypothetical protein
MYMYYSIDDHEANKVNKKVLVIIMIEDEAERMPDFPFFSFFFFSIHLILRSTDVNRILLGWN